MDIMEKNSINRKTIDWPTVRTQALGKVEGAQTIGDVYPAIQFMLTSLGDHHSFYLGNTGNLSAFDKVCEAFSYDESPLPDVGYVKVKEFSGSNAEADQYAQDLQNIIKSQDNEGIVGWVVDLRGNLGGNMWPMVAGIGPILGDGIAGYFIDPDGNESSWSYSNGHSLFETQSVATVATPYILIHPNPKVAVLIDQVTVSSGEATTISFIGRPNTKLFGTATCGLSTSNANFILSDNATLILTTAVLADRNKNKKGSSLIPDVTNETIPQVYPQAVEWLRQ